MRSEIHFADSRWSYVGSSRIPLTLLQQIGEAGDLAVYAESREAGAPSVLYIPAASGRYDLYRERRNEFTGSESEFY